MTGRGRGRDHPGRSRHGRRRQPNLASTSADNSVEFLNAGTLGFSRAVFNAIEADGPGTVTITVTRTGSTDGEVSIRYATSPDTAQAGTDYEALSDTLTWADGEGGDQTFTIPILPDTLNEGKELFRVSLTDPVGNPGLGLTTAVVAIAPSDGAVIDAAAVRPSGRSPGSPTPTGTWPPSDSAAGRGRRPSTGPTRTGTAGGRSS